MVISLPAQPNLTHLKHQAKALLKAHKEGRSDACQTLKLLRRFKTATVQDILAGAAGAAATRNMPWRFNTGSPVGIVSVAT